MDPMLRNLLRAALVFSVLGLIFLSLVIVLQPGETFQDKLEYLRRGCPERGEAEDTMETCFIVVPNGQVLYVETHGEASLSSDHLAYKLDGRNREDPDYALIEGPIAMDISVSNGRWVVALDYWFDCMPEGRVEVENGTVFCHAPAAVRPLTLSG